MVRSNSHIVMRGAVLEGFSLEMTAKDNESLQLAAAGIPKRTPISVTFLPGEDAPARVRAASLVRNLGFEPVPHISARRLSSRDDLSNYLLDLQREAAIDRAFVVAGDPPAPMGPFQDALAVIQSGELARHGVKTVGISGYPEGHREIAEEELWKALKAKHEALRSLGHQVEIMTQFAFDAEVMLRWLERVREEANITSVVRLGVPGPASVKTLLRFASRCGVSATASVMAKYGLSISQLLNTAGPTSLLDELTESLNPSVHGEVQFHFYPFGGLGKTIEWIRRYTSVAPAQAKAHAEVW
jgi:methylenetetrahydrofolate reductase (NADPH)